MLLTKSNSKQNKATVTEIKRTIRKLDYLKNKASRQSKVTRAQDARRKIQMGGLIITAGLDQLFDGLHNPHYKQGADNQNLTEQQTLPHNTMPSPNLLLGLLLGAKEKLRANPNIFKNWEQKGKEFWQDKDE